MPAAWLCLSSSAIAREYDLVVPGSRAMDSETRYDMTSSTMSGVEVLGGSRWRQPGDERRRRDECDSGIECCRCLLNRRRCERCQSTKPASAARRRCFVQVPTVTNRGTLDHGFPRAGYESRLCDKSPTDIILFLPARTSEGRLYRRRASFQGDVITRQAAGRQQCSGPRWSSINRMFPRRGLPNGSNRRSENTD